MDAKELTVKIEVAPWYYEAMEEIAEVLANKNGLFEDTAYQLFENIAGILLNQAVSVATPKYDYNKTHEHKLTIPNHIFVHASNNSGCKTIIENIEKEIRCKKLLESY